MILSELLWQINSTTGSSLWTYFFILFQLHFTTREIKIINKKIEKGNIAPERNVSFFYSFIVIIEPLEEGALLSSGGFGLKCLLKNLSQWLLFSFLFFIYGFQIKSNCYFIIVNYNFFYGIF